MYFPAGISATLLGMYMTSGVLLVGVMVARAFIRSPAHRMPLAWGTLWALVICILGAHLPAKWHFRIPVTTSDMLEPSAVDAEIAMLSNRENGAQYESTSDGVSESEQGRTRSDLLGLAPGALDLRLSVLFERIVVPVLCLGSLFTAARLGVGWWLARRLVMTASPAPSTLSLGNMGDEPHSVQCDVLISGSVSNAMAVGLLRPTIVISSRLLAAAVDNPDGLAMLIAHERAHIHHGDLWFLAGYRLISVFLWANPLIWRLQRQVRLDQEILADALAAGVTRHRYAEELANWARSVGQRRYDTLLPTLGIWEGSSSLRRRLEVLLDESAVIRATCSRGWRSGTLAVTLAVAMVMALCSVERRATAQSPSPPSPAIAPQLKPTATLSGRVHDAQNRPLAGAKVKLNEVEVLTDEEGRFVIDELEPIDFGPGWKKLEEDVVKANEGIEVPNGSIPSSSIVLAYDMEKGTLSRTLCFPPCLMIAHPNFAQTAVPYERIPSVVDVTLTEPAAILKGEIVEWESGLPLPDIMVMALRKVVRSEESKLAWRLRRPVGVANQISDPSGHFRIESLPEASFYILVQSDKYFLQQVMEFQATAGKTTKAEPMKVTLGKKQRVQLVDAENGQPMRFAQPQKASFGVLPHPEDRGSQVTQAVSVSIDGTCDLQLPPWKIRLYGNEENGGWSIDSGGDPGQPVIVDIAAQPTNILSLSVKVSSSATP